MKITCPSCDAKYSIADEKVQGKVAKIRCKKCGATIVVGGANGAVEATTEAAPAAANGAGGASYTVSVTDADQRTMTLPELVEAYHQGVVTGETYVWADGMEDWQPLSNVPDVVAALHGSGSGQTAPEPAAPAYVPEAAPAPAAARRESGRGRSVDLFGGAAAAGSETESQAPPASRRSAPPADQLTGQRGEQSVLFSLNALTQAASSGRTSGPTSSSSHSLGSSSSSSSSKSSEDSGLIDLGALAKAAAEQPQSASSPMMMMPLGAPVLGSPMLEAPATSATTPPPAKSKTGLFVGIGLMVGMVCIAGAIVMTRQKPAEVPTPTSSATAAPTTAPTATDSAAAAPTSSAVDPTATTPAASASAKVVVGGTGGGKRPPGGAPPVGAKANDPPPSSPPPAATPKPPVASGGGCGCAPTDLMCNMACSAKKKK